MKKIILIFLTSMMSFFVSSCGSNLPDKEYYIDVINKELKVGASKAEVLSFLLNKKWDYEYEPLDTTHIYDNRLGKTYFFVRLDEQGFRITKKTILIWIFLDKDGNYEGVEAEQSFTSI